VGPRPVAYLHRHGHDTDAHHLLCNHVAPRLALCTSRLDKHLSSAAVSLYATCAVEQTSAGCVVRRLWIERRQLQFRDEKYGRRLLVPASSRA